jgi:CSLREA domain-containing protein
MNAMSAVRNIFSALALVASANAMAVTITVTTTDDQNGTDATRCSLREAVRAINTSVAFGGCPAGLSAANNKIQLASGIYVLTDELVLTEEVEILGASTYRWFGDTFGTVEGDTDPLTGNKVKRLRPLTTIQAAAGKRILNAATSAGGMELSNLILTGATLAAGNGGVILSSGPVALDNVQVMNGSAQKGGAIYLAGSAGLSLTDATLSGNTASVDGGAVAMDCAFNGSSVARTLSIQRSLVRLNTSASGAGAIALCGDVTAGVEASTFSANSSAATRGALDFTDTSGATDASISLSYVTAAQHGSGYVIRADGLSSFELSNSVLAANSATCLINGVAACTSNDAGYKVITTDMTQLESLGNFGGLTDGYLPKGALLIDQAEAVSSGCSGNDQRNLMRNMGSACDIGAIEKLQLTALEDKGNNVTGDNRVAFVDVLTNDVFGEDGSGIGGIVKPVDFAIDAGLSHAACSYVAATVDHPRPRLKVDNSGVLTPSASPIQCFYRVKDAGGNPVGGAAPVSVLINNIKPVVGNDAYQRNVGVLSIPLNLLANDNDDGDGTYGTDNADLIIMIRGGHPKDAAGVSIPNQVKTSIGVVSGVEYDCDLVPGIVAGSTDDDSVCFEAGTLTYTADNSLHPFTEEFAYTVFDEDGGQSDQGKVTITTDAPAPGSGGTVDWLLLGLLSVAGLRRLRAL